MINLFTTSGILGDWLLNTLNGIGLFIDWILYSFVSWAYQVFIAISQVNLFGESTLRLIIDRVFTVLGIAMLFIMAYEIILLVINPDKLTGENGAKRLVTKVITSIVLIVLLPTIFKYMQIFQYNVITSNVIGNIILGGSTTTNVGDDISKAGTNMALTLATTFFHPIHQGEEYTYTACLDEGNEISSCQTYVEIYEKCLDENNPGGLFMSSKLQGMLNLNIFESIFNIDSKMKYIPIISSLAAIMALKMIIAFSLDIGVRVAKLGFLQVVAPVPIAMNITEKSSIFESKWFKSLKDTYLDIFLKLIVIYFAMFAITLVPEVISNIWATTGNFLVQGFATIAVILGILQFAKDGPKLIKELFNMDLDLSIKKRLNENTYAQRGVATLGGGGAALVSNAYDAIKNKKGFGTGVLSSLGGFASGARHGWKNSEGIDNFNRIGGVIDKSRGEADLGRNKRDSVKRPAIEEQIARAHKQVNEMKAQYKSEGKSWDENAEAWEKDLIAKASQSIPLFTGLRARQMGLKDDVKDVKQSFVDWASGGISSEKLSAAKEMSSMFDKLFNTFSNTNIKGIEEGQKQALKNYENGITPKGIKDENGFVIANPNIKQIKEHYERRKKDEYTEIFKKEMNAPSIKQYGNKIVREMSDSLSKLGPDAQSLVLKEAGLKSLKELQETFEKVGQKNKNGALIFNDTDMAKLRKAADALSDQVKVQSLQQEAATKDKKQ